MTIADNIRLIKERIVAACKGRNPDEIKLIAVSKTKSVEEILQAVEAGQMAFGENYAQELRDKAREIASSATLTPPSPLKGEGDTVTSYNATLTPPSPLKGEGDTITSYNNIEWHFIGHLQKNKIKYVLPVAKWIHTIDSIELLKSINERLANAQTHKRTNVLIEVNIANEPNKSGVTPEKVFSLIETITNVLTCLPAGTAHQPLDKALGKRTNALALKGLMCMPPYFDNPESSRPYFKKLKSLLDEINSRNIYPQKLTELSMGMSHDFEIAIEEGSTIIRVGTAIFGARNLLISDH